MTPGYKTTEFWLNVTSAIVGGIMASGAVTNNVVLQALGFAAMALNALGYTVTRAWLKGQTATAQLQLPGSTP